MKHRSFIRAACLALIYLFIPPTMAGTYVNKGFAFNQGGAAVGQSLPYFVGQSWAQNPGGGGARQSTYGMHQAT